MRNRSIRFIIILPVLLIVILLMPGSAAGQTIYVPDDFATIQAALDAAADLYTIIVRDGIYTGPGNKNLDFNGKALTLRSENGPESCIIDCEGDGRGVYFHNDETSASILDGFTITNGFMDTGGGIAFKNSSPTIINCIIDNNRANNGGGVATSGITLPKIENCVIISNTASIHGGGVYCNGLAGPTISGCVISGNSAISSGGGIHCTGTVTVYVEDTTITQNIADVGGGIGVAAPIFLYIDNCTISDNSAVTMGGGVYARSLNLNITDTDITRNIADFGGGFYLSGPPAGLDIINCILGGNSATYDGGGIYFGEATPAISNCTIIDNSAGRYGGGIHCSWYASSPTTGTAFSITNSILDGNSAVLGAEISLFGSSRMNINHSNVRGGMQAIYVEASSFLELGEGNTAADPLFASGPLGDYYLSQRAAGQGASSPCIDAGGDTAASAGLESYTTRTDEVGDTGLVDMGYHYPGFVVGELSQIHCTGPANESVRESAPTFSWAPDGGSNNVFVVDMALSVDGPYYTSPVIRGETNWTMPQAWWDVIPSGSYVYWFVRGADLDATPLKVIYSAEVWWFYKP